MLILEANAPSPMANEGPSQDPNPSSGILRSNQKHQTAQKQNKPQADQQGTEQSPIFVKIAPSPQTQEESSKAEREKEQKAATEYRTEITTWIVASATALQAIGLFVTVAVMVRTARRQLRAYVFPETCGICEGMMLDPPQSDRANQPGVFLIFKNSGKTPAYKVTSWAQIDVIEQINENSLKVLAPIPAISTFPLAADGTSSKALWFGRPLSAYEIADISNGHRAIYVHGRVEYVDAFKAKRFTNFRVRYSGAFPPPPNVTFSFCERGNSAN